MEFGDILCLLQSSVWQLQAISLIIIRLQFQKSLTAQISSSEGISHQGNGRQSTVLQKTGRSKVTSTPQGKTLSKSTRAMAADKDLATSHFKECLKFCRSGHVRLLMWFTFHSSSLLRRLSLEV